MGPPEVLIVPYIITYRLVWLYCFVYYLTRLVPLLLGDNIILSLVEIYNGRLI